MNLKIYWNLVRVENTRDRFITVKSGFQVAVKGEEMWLITLRGTQDQRFGCCYGPANIERHLHMQCVSNSKLHRYWIHMLQWHICYYGPLMNIRHVGYCVGLLWIGIIRKRLYHVGLCYIVRKWCWKTCLTVGRGGDLDQFKLMIPGVAWCMHPGAVTV